MISALVIIAMAVINRFRGGGFLADRAPIHPRFIAAGAVAILALLIAPWWQAALIGAGYLIWCWPSWGYLITLGFFTPQRDPTWIEKAFLRASFGEPVVALALRMALVAPFIVAASLSPFETVLAPIAGAAIAILYAVSWAARPKSPIELAELLTGAFLGLILVFA